MLYRATHFYLAARPQRQLHAATRPHRIRDYCRCRAQSLHLFIIFLLGKSSTTASGGNLVFMLPRWSTKSSNFNSSPKCSSTKREQKSTPIRHCAALEVNCLFFVRKCWRQRRSSQWLIIVRSPGTVQLYCACVRLPAPPCICPRILAPARAVPSLPGRDTALCLTYTTTLRLFFYDWQLKCRLTT